MDVNKDQVEAAGFKVDAGGNIRTAGGQRVKAAVADAVANGTIIAGFDINSLRKAKSSKAAQGGMSLIEALDKISPDIGNLAVGMTAKIKMPTEKVVRKGKGGVEKELDPKRSFVMSVVTKIGSITQKGREWSGRVFDAVSDPEGTYLYVSRLEDTDTPHTRKPGGGRKPASSAAGNLNAALDAAKKHLGGGQEPNTDDAQTQEVAKEAADGNAVRIGGQEGGESLSEEATVIKA